MITARAIHAIKIKSDIMDSEMQKHCGGVLIHHAQSLQSY